MKFFSQSKNEAFPQTVLATSLGSLVIAANMLASVASAEDCAFDSGKEIRGSYQQAKLSYGPDRYGYPPEGSRISAQQDGCKLVVKSSTRYNTWDSNVQKSVTKTDNTGTWVFDLSGRSPAQIPKQFIENNSHDPSSKLSAESLTVYTKKISGDQVEISAEFIIEAVGIKQRIRAKGLTKIEDFQSQGLTGQQSLSPIYPGLTFELISDAELAREQGVRYLAIQVGGNWVLKYLEKFLNDSIRPWEFRFDRVNSKK